MNFLRANKNNKHAWNLRCEIIMERAKKNTMGYADCDFCGREFNVLTMHVGVYYKKSFPIWFLDENNYICCSSCTPDKNVRKRIKEKYPYYISYKNEDIARLIDKQKTQLKNHRWRINR